MQPSQYKVEKILDTTDNEGNYYINITKSETKLLSAEITNIDSKSCVFEKHRPSRSYSRTVDLTQKTIAYNADIAVEDNYGNYITSRGCLSLRWASCMPKVSPLNYPGDGTFVSNEHLTPFRLYLITANDTLYSERLAKGIIRKFS